MNIKSLLLGSAAALAVVSGAQAADAIVAAEPEPAEYVKVCDAFGTGYFYIPGTETCLKVGGYVRFNVDFNSNTVADSKVTSSKGLNARKWNATTKADINLSAKSETELGNLEGYIDLNSTNDNGTLISQNSATQVYSANNFFRIDSAYIALGGLKAGYFAGYFDAGIGESSTWASASKFNAVSYTYTADGFSLGLGIDEIREAEIEKVIDKAYIADPATNATFKDRNNNGIGIEGLASFSLGGVSASLIGVYDADTSNGAVKGIVSADVGPGTLKVAGLWANGENIYTGLNTFDSTSGKLNGTGGKWAIGAAYSYKATENLTIMPEFQTGEYLENSNGKSAKAWMVGALTTYKIADGLNASVDVNYNHTTSTDNKDDHSVSGYFRLQRSF